MLVGIGTHPRVLCLCSGEPDDGHVAPKFFSLSSSSNPQHTHTHTNSCAVTLCRTQEEMVHTCRGTVNLAGAFVDTIDATNFVITNGPSQVRDLM